MTCSRFNQEDSQAGRADYVATGGCTLHPGCHCDPAQPCPITQERRHAVLQPRRDLDARLLLSSRAIERQAAPSRWARLLRWLKVR